jgi:PRTRC genetic system protein E
MFVEIEPLLRTCSKLTLSLQMKGDEMVVFVMPQGSAKDAAMLQPLALTASAAELDAGFADALASYTGAHASLAEQVAATTAILESAQKTQVTKATKALTNGTGKSKPARPAESSEEDPEDEESDASAEQSTASTSTASTDSPAAATAAPAAEKTGTDLTSLFD